jgi:hypothetical protein
MNMPNIKDGDSTEDLTWKWQDSKGLMLGKSKGGRAPRQ